LPRAVSALSAPVPSLPTAPQLSSSPRNGNKLRTACEDVSGYQIGQCWTFQADGRVCWVSERVHTELNEARTKRYIMAVSDLPKSPETPK
jgi:hypothetical protein